MSKKKARAKRRPSRAPKSPTSIIRVSDDADRGMFIRQFKDHVVYGVSQTTTKAAIRDFKVLKHFVEVEIPELEASNTEAKLRISEKLARERATPPTET